MTEDRNDQGPKWMYAVGLYGHGASADLSHENFQSSWFTRC